MYFPDVLILKRTDESFGHFDYHKQMHTDTYVHWKSNHHLRQKHAVEKTLIDQAIWICELQYVADEMKQLDATLQASGYSTM